MGYLLMSHQRSQLILQGGSSLGFFEKKLLLLSGVLNKRIWKSFTVHFKITRFYNNITPQHFLIDPAILLLEICTTKHTQREFTVVLLIIVKNHNQLKNIH